MKKIQITHKNVGIPTFKDILPLDSEKVGDIFTSPTLQTSRGCEMYDDLDLSLFDLSSHKRARDAIEFGLKMRSKGFHVFVVGEDRSGRMTSTLSYLKQYVKTLPAPKDWVYVNNFLHNHKPKPYSFPPGQGVHFKEKLDELIENVATVLNKTLNSPHFVRQIDKLTTSLQYKIEQHIHEIQEYAKVKGYAVNQTADGFSIELIDTENEEVNDNSIEMQIIRDRINKMSLNANLSTQRVHKKINEHVQTTSKKAISLLFEKFNDEFEPFVSEWIDELKNDILKQAKGFHSFAENGDEENQETIPEHLRERYSANVLVNNESAKHAKVILEHNPTYENLFGSIKYRANDSGALETNFTMIRPGSLHSANGGILVLRGDALARNPEIWEMLKSALRDQVVRIEERYRDNTLPLLEAPEPKPIPLDIQVFLIASPYWYYNFFFNDPEFRSYFKIKADIEDEMPATEDNVRIYRQLLKHNSLKLTGKQINDDALDYLLGCSARKVGHRERLSAEFEQIADVLLESEINMDDQGIITKEAIRKTLSMRRIRNAGSEDRSHQEIESGQILIDTSGTSIGQINALSVISTGDHNFGLPCRISARSYAGDVGVLNIERLTELAGPIQQKGAMILEGFLNGFFAQKFPLSYTCSLTFEQSYVDVDGDSASMAEVIAILSSLSGVPIRQDIAITGSMNQFGVTQPIGGAHYKVEGFHRVCKAKGLTGKQGVILPRMNIVNLTLHEDVVEDIKCGRFAIWPVDTVFEAIELMLDTSCGLTHDETGAHSAKYPFFTFKKGDLFNRVEKNLLRYHRLVKEGHSKRIR
ncbi:MAG: AAA family ATPase [Pseudomonadota bacterium]